MDPIEPTPLAVTVDARRVPTVLWRRPGPAVPMVLLGHGGSGHKSAARQRAIADRIVAAGLVAVAIDGPAHGERALHPPGDYQSHLAARGIESVLRDTVADWHAAIAAARALGAANDTLGYLGLSMGTRFGLALAADLGDQLTCAVLGKLGLRQSPVLHPGIHDPMQLRSDAEQVVAPTMWHVQWDDELFPRSGQLELFGHLGSKDKQLVAVPGKHATTPAAVVDEWVRLLVRHLAARG